MEENYKNREIDEKFEKVHFKLDSMSSHNTTMLDAILEQTQKTNGRVTKNEDEIAGIKEWNSKITGGIIVASSVLAITGTLIGFFMPRWFISIMDERISKFAKDYNIVYTPN